MIPRKPVAVHHNIIPSLVPSVPARGRTYLHPFRHIRAGVVICACPSAGAEPALIVLLQVVPAVKPVGEYSDAVVGYRADNAALVKDHVGDTAENGGKI